MKKIEFARELRKRSTHSEHKLWLKLRDRKLLGHKFKRQFVIRGFIVDFYCSELKLAIEVDGGIHKYQQEYDRLRQEAIEKGGVEFLRFKSKDVIDNLSAVVEKIKLWKAHQPSPPSSATRERGRG